MVGGRYGLASKDTPPSSVFAVYTELEDARPREFTVGIVDDVTNLSFPKIRRAQYGCRGTIALGLHFWASATGYRKGANKNSIKIIGDHTDKYVQAYFQYDSKKTAA